MSLVLVDLLNPLVSSFVRSVTMDKWKDIELEKMKAGGNAKFREFLESQEDYDPGWSLQEKYNSRAAALFRDKVEMGPTHSCPMVRGCSAFSGSGVGSFAGSDTPTGPHIVRDRKECRGPCCPAQRGGTWLVGEMDLPCLQERK